MITYGDAPVPWTASWTDEFPYFVARCPHAKMLAIRQPQFHLTERNAAKPLYKNPNFDRQRKAVILGLCDLCARPLKGHTAISLSQAKHDAMIGGMAQVEPMMHKRCARIALQNCPSLRKQQAEDRLYVRMITRWRPRLLVMLPKAIEEHVPGYTGPKEHVIGMAKVELLDWIERDADWLERKM